MGFSEVWERIGKSSPVDFPEISLKASIQNNGPVIPYQAFERIDALEAWYEVVLSQWMKDWHAPIDDWHDRLEDDTLRLGLLSIALEARNAGIRRIQSQVFREFEGSARATPINNVAELVRWCAFMLRLLEDDDEYVEARRHHLTIRYDLGVAERNSRDRERLTKELDPWVASITSAFMERISKGQPREVPPDDEWILVVWSGLMADKSTDQVVASLYVDAVETPKQPNPILLTDVTESTWRVMRRLDVLTEPEPVSTTYAEVRGVLDHLTMRLDELAGRSLSEHGDGNQKEFDVFLSHNSNDKPFVRRLGRRLRKEGLRVWIDEDDLRPGEPWQESLESAIETCKSVAVLVGESGMGPWQDREVRSCLNEFVRRDLPVVPVILPKCETVPELPLFLREFTWVDLRLGIRKIGVEKLVWGLTGQRPSETI